LGLSFAVTSLAFPCKPAVTALLRLTFYIASLQDFQDLLLSVAMTNVATIKWHYCQHKKLQRT